MHHLAQVPELIAGWENGKVEVRNEKSGEAAALPFWGPRNQDMANEYGLIEGSLEVKFPTIWTDGKAEAGRVR